MADARIPPPGLEALVTESRAEGAADHDLRPTVELVQAMAVEDAAVPRAVAAAAPAVAAAIDAIVQRLEAGGRLVYIGAGSSGRIAALDASECESTFSTRPGQVIAVVAGDGLASAAQRDAAEDDDDAGARAIQTLSVTAADAVVAISASGRTPFALGALRAARAAGALTVALVSVPASELAELADHELAVVVGPEFVAGSTRLKAGTAQKLVLNQLSTIAMIRLGKTYGDLMVDVTGTNEKLRARSRRAVLLATGASEEEVDRALADADGSAKVAIVSLLAGVDALEARARLERSGGRVREALT
jgi:N-acetylmuramic acid 6-phosphate etherase